MSCDYGHLEINVRVHKFINIHGIWHIWGELEIAWKHDFHLPVYDVKVKKKQGNESPRTINKIFYFLDESMLISLREEKQKKNLSWSVERCR